MHNRKGEKAAPPAGSLWIEQAATYIGVQLSTLRKWRLVGKEPGPKGYPIGRFIAYRISDLDAYLNEQYRTAMALDPKTVHDSRPPEPRSYRATHAA